MVNITVKKSVKNKGPKKVKAKVLKKGKGLQTQQKQGQQTQNVVVNVNKKTNAPRTARAPTQPKPQVIAQPQQQSSDLNQYFKILEEQKKSIPEKIKTQVKEAIKNELERDRKKVVTDEEVQNKFTSITPDLNITPILTDEKVFIKHEDISDKGYIQTLLSTATNADSNLMDGQARVSNFVVYEPPAEPLHTTYSPIQLINMVEPEVIKPELLFDYSLLPDLSKLSTYIEEDENKRLPEFNEPIIPFQIVEPTENKLKPIEDSYIDIPDEETIIIDQPEIIKLTFEEAPQQAILITEKSDLPKATVQLDETQTDKKDIIDEPINDPLLSVVKAESKVIKQKKGQVIPEDETIVTPVKSSKKKPQEIQIADEIIGLPTPKFSSMKNAELAPLYKKYVSPNANIYETGEGYIKVKEGSKSVTGGDMALRLEQRFEQIKKQQSPLLTTSTKKSSGKKSTQEKGTII